MKTEYSEAKIAGKLNILYEALCAVILGGACLYVFISMFDLDYSPGSMFSGSFVGGLAGIWDAVADKLGSLDYVILPKYKADIAADGSVQYGMALTVFFAMLSVLSFFIIKSRIRLLLLVYAVPLAVLVVAFMLSPSMVSGIVFGAALIVVLSLINIPEEIKPAYFIMPVVALLVGAGAVFALDRTVSLNEPKAFARLGDSARAATEQRLYGTDPLPAGDIGSITGKDIKAGRGDIQSVKAALGASSAEGSKASGEGGKTALTVEMSEPESYYLRGFVGAEYEKSKWSTLSNDTFYDMRDKIFWLNRRGFDGLSEMSYATKLGGLKTKNISMKVTVKDASRKIAFTPYELDLAAAPGEGVRTSEMILPEGTKNYGGSYLGTEGLRGKSEYSYKSSGNITGAWTDAVGKFYTTKADDEINTFFLNESHYNVIQYDKYLDIPEYLLPLFKKEIGETGDISKDHADYKDAIEVITKYLKDKYIYSEAFTAAVAENGADKTGSSKSSSKSGSSGSNGSFKKEFTEKFIEEKKGCDIHFATLATLMFRYYGIPARYVEGYLITPANIKGASGETTVDVPRSACHAWTEIYIDGFGWVPIEATPEYSGIMKEADLTKGLQNVDYESTQKNRTSTEDEQPTTEENEEEDDLRALLLKILLFVLAVLGSILLLALLVIAIVKLIIFLKWRMAFSNKNPKMGISALYQFAAINKWKLADAGEYLGYRATYSQDRMDEDDRARMRAEVKQAKEEAKAEKKARKEAKKAKERTDQLTR